MNTLPKMERENMKTKLLWIATIASLWVLRLHEIILLGATIKLGEYMSNKYRNKLVVCVTGCTLFQLEQLTKILAREMSLHVLR